MFNENVRPGDGVSFIEGTTGRIMVRMTLRSIEFTQRDQFIRVDATMGPNPKPIHEFRVNPHRQIAFPDRASGTTIGCVEFYEPQIDFGVCTVPIVIHASDGISVHVDHSDAVSANN
jgi:hypothetical protein